MAFTNLASSGELKTGSSAALTWTHTPTLNNLMTCMTEEFNTAPSSTAVTDSSGSPKQFTADAIVGSATGCAIYSLVVPSGFTSPATDANPAQFRSTIFDEWSGNATSLVLNQSSTNSSGPSVTSADTGAINTGANAGLVLAIIRSDGASEVSFSQNTASFTQEFLETDGANFQPGAAYNRTTSVASQTALKAAWTWTPGHPYEAAIASYNLAAAAGGNLPPGLGPVDNMQQAFISDMSLMR